MPRPPLLPHVPGSTDELVTVLLKVKPTADMPGRGNKAKAAKKVVRKTDKLGL